MSEHVVGVVFHDESNGVNVWEVFPAGTGDFGGLGVNSLGFGANFHNISL